MSVGEGEAVDFWRGMALAMAGQTAEAEALLASLEGNKSGVFYQEAVLNRAALWAGRGESARAISILSAGLVSPDAAFVARLKHRLAELYLAQGQPAEAEMLLEGAPDSLERSALLARTALAAGRVGDALRLASIVATRAPAGPLRATARLVQAQVKAASGEAVEANRALIEWIRAEPETPHLPAIILTLDKIGGLEAPEVNALLAEWAAGSSPQLAEAAQFALAAVPAARQQWAEAQARFAAFAQAHPAHPLAPVARVRAVEMAVQGGAQGEARAAAQAWREECAQTGLSARQSRASFLAGQAVWAENAEEAAEAFRGAARHAPDPLVARAALLNAALCDAQAGRPLEEVLEPLAPWPEARKTALLEMGLALAPSRQTDAAAALERFLAENPEEPRAMEALCALTEIDLSRTPPAVPAARQHLRAARRAARSSAWNERLDWLALWIEEADGQIAAAIEKARLYLIDWQQSPRRASARLKRADWLGRLGQWPEAAAEYMTLSDEAGMQPALSARAIYLAGLAELRIPSPDSLDQAIDRWGEAAQADETMTFPARLQQAVAKIRLGRQDEALRQLEALIAGPPALTPVQRAAALLMLGDLSLRPDAAGTAHPAEALVSFSQVANEPGVSPAVRAQALTRQGEALRQLHRPEEALAAFTEAARPLLSPPPGAPPLSETAAAWPLRGGLAAVALLEEQQNWKAAADLAQQLGSSPGPHATRAREKAARLRLERFIWDE